MLLTVVRHPFTCHTTDGVITYTFAVLGMEMFGNAVVDPARNTTAFLTSQHANFGNFQKSVVLLFQISTENNWNEVGSLVN